MKNEIKFCHINITSVLKHKHELLANYGNNDIISINETQLQKHKTFAIPGFNIFRNDGAQAKGSGVILAVRDNITSNEIMNKTEDHNEIVAIEINSKALGKITVASLYVHPQKKIKEEWLRELHDSNTSCLIMGDLNAALKSKGSVNTNRNGRQLGMILEEGQFTCVDEQLTTYERGDYKEKLDWILATQPLFMMIRSVKTNPTLGISSGHNPMTFEIQITAEEMPTSPRPTLNYKKADWNKYRRELDQLLQERNILSKPQNATEIEEMSQFITNCMNEAANRSIPTAGKLIQSENISNATRKLIDEKHRTYRKWKKTNLETDKKQFYLMKTLLSNSIRNDKKRNFMEMMSALSKKKMYSDQVWNTVKRFHNKRVKNSFSAKLVYDNNIATTNQEKADMFARYFSKEVYISTPDKTKFQKFVREQAALIKKKHRKKNKPDDNWEVISSKEIKLMIKSLRNSAPGPDKVHNRMIKNHTERFIQMLNILFNAVIMIGHIPEMWKKAHIILLLKPNKNNQDPKSYRPISLLSCLGKLLEKIMKKRLAQELEEKGLLPQHQAGFRAGKNTLYNIVRIERFAKQMIEAKTPAAAIFFDIKAAFDSVWHNGLIYKLDNLRIQPNIVKYLIEFLGKRTACIELENILSKEFKLGSGTPQGSPLSPLLYIIYTSESTKSIPPHTHYGLFADDTALWTSGNNYSRLRKRLQTSVDTFKSWCETWKLQLQPLKTELINFTHRPRKNFTKKIFVKIQDQTITAVKEARYLGVILDSNLSWKKHYEHIKKTTVSRTSLLRFLSNSRNDTNPIIMANLFKSLVRSKIVYGSAAFATAKEDIWKKLQIIQNQALRAALNLPKYASTEYLHKTTKIEKIKNYVKQCLEITIMRALDNNDHTLHQLLKNIENELNPNNFQTTS